jgi:hypothetical protein
MNEYPCAYCGKPALKQDKEHVFPRCLYPPSKTQSNVQRLTIPACKSCNNGWSDDEAHFRNILTVAGDPNPSRLELFNTNVMRSFDKADGIRRMDDLLVKMKPVKMDNGSSRQMVYPGEDKQVLRVVKKVVRGLCYYHNVVWPISDKRVWADVLKYDIPKALFDQMEYHHRDQDIVEYRYQVLNEHEINSAWLITFFQRVTFVGLVSISENGFS